MSFLLSRRQLLALAPACAATAQPRIDRRRLVQRHNPTLHSADVTAPLSLGNGEFAFTADFTGLQTFPQLYERTIPLCTQSQWGWHSFPLPGGLDPAKFRLEMFDTYGRQAGYATSSKGQERLFAWLRENPHRLNLARIGLRLDGRPLALDQVTGTEQKLDLWSGLLESRFQLGGTPVTVLTCCHPRIDALAISVRSALGPRLSIAIEFPYGSPEIHASDWDAPDRHRTTVAGRGAHAMQLERRLDGDRYPVNVSADAVTFEPPHRVVANGSDVVVSFTAEPMPSAAATRTAAEAHWNRFWSEGGAIDLSASTDPRAGELERRMVLSQYLSAIQCAGSMPPQETGLTCNSWFGKFHLEMHWWHAAHFVLWDRTALLERSLGWYGATLPSARDKARQQGYTGARWPKMVGPDGRDSPSPIGSLLIWQQPHPIKMAELCYQGHPGRATLDRYREVVMESAEFMASFAVLRDGRYVLGPPVIPAQENHPPRETWNPTFEVVYWADALEIAQQWRQRLGMARHPKWDEVRSKLAPLPVKDGVYLAHENCPQTFTERNRDHPSMLAACGMLPGAGVDRETMRRTLHKVFAEWRWADTWGWDFPMVAMTAARLGEPERAIDALFIESPKNTWLANGHNQQRAGLPLYLPGNGALLLAIALMAAGKPSGFPARTWAPVWENLTPL